MAVCVGATTVEGSLAPTNNAPRNKTSPDFMPPARRLNRSPPRRILPPGTPPSQAHIDPYIPPPPRRARSISVVHVLRVLSRLALQLMAATVLCLALLYAPIVYQELHLHHEDITPEDVAHLLNIHGWQLPKSADAADALQVLAVPLWLRLAKALALTTFCVLVVASAPSTERPIGLLLLPVPLGFLALRGTAWLALRLIAIWLPIWVAACLYTHLAFHVMAASLSLTAWSLAGGWRGAGARGGRRLLAACWTLAVAATTLLADAVVESLSKLALFQPASAWRYLVLGVLPQLCLALVFIKMHILHTKWKTSAAEHLAARDTLANARTCSLRRVARRLLLLSRRLRISYAMRLQLLCLLVAAHAARTYLFPSLASMDVLPSAFRAFFHHGPYLLFVCFAYLTNDCAWRSQVLSVSPR